MDSKKSVIFFAFIVTANCYLSDRISELFAKNCNQPKSQLEPLKLEFCSIPGDRGIEDILCNGISEIIQDICRNSSSVTIEQVINSSSKVAEDPETFCKKVASLNGFANMPQNVSENLKKMKSSLSTCTALCILLEHGKLNPLCPFLVSYSILKNGTATVPKAENVSNTAAEKSPVPNTATEKNLNAAVQNNPNDTTKNKPKEQTKQSAPGESSNNDPPKANVSKQDGLNDIQGEPDGEPQQIDAGQKKFNGDLNPVVQPADENPNGIPVPLENTDDENNEQNEDLANHPAENQGDGVALEPLPKKDSNQELPHQELGPADRMKDPFENAGDSNFFTYFIFISAICICFYIAMYNKKKILALVIEGRRTSVKRRPNSAAYSKLDCTLEEAMASGPSTSSSNTLLY